MTYKIVKLSLFALSRFIWLCIIFFVVVHAVQYFDTNAHPDQEILSLLLFFEGTAAIGNLFAQYWPTEILITIIGFFIFEAVGSKFTYILASKIGGKIRKRASLKPLDFDFEIESGNYTHGLAAIEIKNDEKTPMEFIVEILQEHFRLDHEEAVKLMLEIHTKGSARIQWIDAEKAIKVIENISREANERSYPLECNIVLA